MPVIAIAAHDPNKGIGKNGTLPWHNPEDFRNFKAVTSGYTVIMGSATFRSIGKPLPNRRNIVLSRTALEIPGVEVFLSIPELLVHFHTEAAIKPVFILGGAQIYAQFLEQGLLDELWISIIPDIHECDAFFPEYSNRYIEYERIAFETFDFVKFRRINQA